MITSVTRPRRCGKELAESRASERIIGYYTLSAASFEKDRLPAELAKRLPHYPVPAVVIGRLAVDQGHQGRGLGEFLLLDAIRRVVRASDVVGVYAVVVDAKNDRALAFYERYGFRSFPSTARRLFLPLRTFEMLGAVNRKTTLEVRPRPGACAIRRHPIGRLIQATPPPF